MTISSAYNIHIPIRTIVLKELYAHIQNKENDSSLEMKNDDILSTTMKVMEEEVLVSSQARLDQQQLQNSFMNLLAPFSDNILSRVFPVRRDVSSSSSIDIWNLGLSQKVRLQVTRWNVAVVAGFTSFIIVLLIFHSLLPSFISLLVITFIASRDPILMEGDEDSVISKFLGPISRLLGYSVLGYVEKIYQKLYILVQAIFTDSNELESLRNQVESLQQTNHKLNLWIQQRQYVDETMGNYTVDELKVLLRQNNLSVSGSKVQLMMRLFEAGVLEMKKK